METHAKVVVIGGGVSGCSVAYHLAKAGWTDVEWQDWSAATRLAVREARRRVGPSLPLHLVGFSNGGALALKYALDSLEDKSLRRPQQVILLSPMIGVTAFGVFLTPVFYVLMRKLAGNRPLARHDIEPPALQAAE